MQTIFKTIGSTFYAPTADNSGMEAKPCDSAQAAMRRLLGMAEVFLDHQLTYPDDQPPTGFHVFRNTLAGGYLVLAVTTQGAAVYAADQQDLDRMNLPVPRSTLSC